MSKGITVQSADNRRAIVLQIGDKLRSRVNQGVFTVISFRDPPNTKRMIGLSDSNKNTHWVKGKTLIDGFDVIQKNGQLQIPGAGIQRCESVPTQKSLGQCTFEKGHTGLHSFQIKPPLTLNTVRQELKITAGDLAVLKQLAKENDTPEEQTKAKAKGFKSPYWVSVHSFIAGSLHAPWSDFDTKQRNFITGGLEASRKISHMIGGQFRYQKIYGEAEKAALDGKSSHEATLSIGGQIIGKISSFQAARPLTKAEKAKARHKPIWTRTDT